MQVSPIREGIIKKPGVLCVDVSLSERGWDLLQPTITYSGIMRKYAVACFGVSLNQSLVCLPDRFDCEDSGNGWSGPSLWIIMEVTTFQLI